MNILSALITLLDIKMSAAEILRAGLLLFTQHRFETLRKISRMSGRKFDWRAVGYMAPLGKPTCKCNPV